MPDENVEIPVETAPNLPPPELPIEPEIQMPDLPGPVPVPEFAVKIPMAIWDQIVRSATWNISFAQLVLSQETVDPPYEAVLDDQGSPTGEIVDVGPPTAVLVTFREGAPMERIVAFVDEVKTQNHIEKMSDHAR